MTKQEQSFKMARRLKDLREERNLSHDKLKAALLEQFGITISRDSLMSYEIQTEPHSKIKNGKYPNLNMGVEYLNAFAQFYGVSSDYLLGLSNHPTLDAQEAGAAEYTGLPIEAIRALREFKIMPLFADALNYFVCSPEFQQLVIDLFHFREKVKEAVAMAENPAAERHESGGNLMNAQFMEFLATRNFDRLFGRVLKEEIGKSSVIKKSPDGEGFIWQWSFGGKDDGKH